MTHRPINEALRSEETWQEYLANYGPEVALEALSHMRADLKAQRARKAPEPGISPEEHAEWRAWVKKQRGFESVVTRRAVEAHDLIAQQGDPIHRLQRQVGQLTEALKKLALGVDGEDGDEILDEITMPFGERTITLAEAIDEGVLA